MKLQSQNIFLLAAGCLLTAFGIIFLHYYPKPQSINQKQGYKQLARAEDKAPLPQAAPGREIKIPILMYHHVGDLPKNADAIRRDLTVPTADFEQEVKWLAEQGYSSIKLEDAYLYSKGQAVLPKKPVIFTFDDGYRDVFDNAVPILKQYGFTGSFGIITQNPGETEGDNAYASWEQIAAAYLAGNEIVSHTQNHFDGKDPKYSFDYIFKNLSGSINDIRANLNFTTNVLIYPYGHYSVGYVEQAKKAGFVMGVTVHEGNKINLDDLMEAPRVRVHGREDIERFKKLIEE